MLTEYTNSPQTLSLIGEVEAEDQEQAYKLAQQTFPNVTIHRMDDGVNVYEMRGMSIHSSNML
jgi:hypothetical protein